MIKHNLPQGWQMKTLEEVCEFKSGYTPKKDELCNNGNIPYFKISDMNAPNNEKYMQSAQLFLKGDTNRVFPQNSIIFPKNGGAIFTNKKRILVKNSVVDLNTAILIPKLNIDLDYIFNFILSVDLGAFLKGSILPTIDTKSFLNLKIPLPPLEIQKAIVEKLENAFAHIDEAVRHLRAVQTNIPRLKSSLLHCAFNGKLTESQNQSNEVQTLKSVVGVEGEFEREEGATSPFKPLHPLIKEGIPQGWEVKTLGEVCEIVTGSTPNKNNAEYYGDDFPFYKPTDLNNGYYVEAASDNVSPKGFEISRQLPSGSVLVTCIGATIGKTGLIRKKGICNQQINAILPSQKFISEFIYFYCISPKVQNFIKTNASSTTLPILNKANFSKLPIPLPPLETQNQIVQILESKFAHLEKLAQFVNASLENLQRLKSSLLNQAFKGELV